MQDGNGVGLTIRFWGVRGSIPTPGRETVRFGGDTTCIEISNQHHMLIIDCGSGARRLGIHMRENKLFRADVLFTHCHLDHICGLPFFSPAFFDNADIRCWAGHLPDRDAFVSALGKLMSPPVFPVDTSVLLGCKFDVFKPGETLQLDGGFSVHTCPTNHPGGCTGYRIEYAGKSICIITDHEHGNPKLDADVLRFVQNADVMVYDSMFVDDEYQNFVGWGHSTWQQCLKVAKSASVKVPIMFHHDHSRTDDALDVIEAKAQAIFPEALVASQAMELHL